MSFPTLSNSHVSRAQDHRRHRPLDAHLPRRLRPGPADDHRHRPSSVPAGATLTVTVTTPGHAVFVFAVTIGNVTTTIPTTATYGTRQILRLGIDAVSGSTVTADNALEILGLLGDTDGNGQYDANDASLVQRVIVGAYRGFSAWADIDPVLLADIARRGALISLDATRIAQEAYGNARPEFAPPPAIPYTVDATVLLTGLIRSTPSPGGIVFTNAEMVPDLSLDGSLIPDTDHMRVKLARAFTDFSLSGTASNAAWKGDFVTALAGQGPQTSALRITLT